MSVSVAARAIRASCRFTLFILSILFITCSSFNVVAHSTNGNSRTTVKSKVSSKSVTDTMKSSELLKSELNVLLSLGGGIAYNRSELIFHLWKDAFQLEGALRSDTAEDNTKKKKNKKKKNKKEKLDEPTFSYLNISEHYANVNRTIHLFNTFHAKVRLVETLLMLHSFADPSAAPGSHMFLPTPIINFTQRPAQNTSVVFRVITDWNMGTGDREYGGNGTNGAMSRFQSRMEKLLRYTETKKDSAASAVGLAFPAFVYSMLRPSFRVLNNNHRDTVWPPFSKRTFAELAFEPSLPVQTPLINCNGTHHHAQLTKTQKQKLLQAKTLPTIYPYAPLTVIHEIRVVTQYQTFVIPVMVSSGQLSIENTYLQGCNEDPTGTLQSIYRPLMVEAPPLIDFLPTNIPAKEMASIAFTMQATNSSSAVPSSSSSSYSSPSHPTLSGAAASVPWHLFNPFHAPRRFAANQSAVHAPVLKLWLAQRTKTELLSEIAEKKALKSALPSKNSALQSFAARYDRVPPVRIEGSLDFGALNMLPRAHKQFLLRLRNENAFEMHIGNISLTHLEVDGLGTVPGAAVATREIAAKFISTCWLDDNQIEALNNGYFMPNRAQRWFGDNLPTNTASSASTTGTQQPLNHLDDRTLHSPRDYLDAFAHRRALTASQQYNVSTVRLFQTTKRDIADAAAITMRRSAKEMEFQASVLEKREQILEALGGSEKAAAQYDDAWIEGRPGVKARLDAMLADATPILDAMPDTVFECKQTSSMFFDPKAKNSNKGVSGQYLSKHPLRDSRLRVLKPGERAVLLVTLHVNESTLLTLATQKYLEGLATGKKFTKQPWKTSITPNFVYKLQARLSLDTTLERQALRLNVGALLYSTQPSSVVQLSLFPSKIKSTKNYSLFPPTAPRLSSAASSSALTTAAFTPGYTFSHAQGNSLNFQVRVRNKSPVPQYLVRVQASDPRIIVHDFSPYVNWTHITAGEPQMIHQGVGPNGKKLKVMPVFEPTPYTGKFMISTKSALHSLFNASMTTFASLGGWIPSQNTTLGPYYALFNVSVFRDPYDWKMSNLSPEQLRVLDDMNYMKGFNVTLTSAELNEVRKGVRQIADASYSADRALNISYPIPLLNALADVNAGVNTWNQYYAAKQGVLEANITATFSSTGPATIALPAITFTRPSVVTSPIVNFGTSSILLGGEGSKKGSKKTVSRMIAVRNPSTKHAVEIFLIDPFPVPSHNVARIAQPSTTVSKASKPILWSSIEEGLFAADFFEPLPDYVSNLTFPFVLMSNSSNYVNSVVLAPGASGSIGPVGFKPTATGAFTGMLALFNNLTRVSFIRLKGKGGAGRAGFLDYKVYSLEQPKKNSATASPANKYPTFPWLPAQRFSRHSTQTISNMVNQTAGAPLLVSNLSINYTSKFQSQKYFKSKTLSDMLPLLQDSKQLRLKYSYLNESLLFEIVNLGEYEVVLNNFSWTRTTQWNRTHPLEDVSSSEGDSESPPPVSDGILFNACDDAHPQYGFSVHGCELLPLSISPSMSYSFRVFYLPVLTQSVPEDFALVAHHNWGPSVVNMRLTLPSEWQSFLSKQSEKKDGTDFTAVIVAVIVAVAGIGFTLRSKFQSPSAASASTGHSAAVSAAPAAVASSAAIIPPSDADADDDDTSSAISSSSVSGQKKKKKSKSKSKASSAKSTAPTETETETEVETDGEVHTEGETDGGEDADQDMEKHEIAYAVAAIAEAGGVSKGADSSDESDDDTPSAPNSSGKRVRFAPTESALRKAAKKAARKAAKAREAEALNSLQQQSDLTPAAQSSLEKLYDKPQETVEQEEVVAWPAAVEDSAATAAAKKKKPIPAFDEAAATPLWKKEPAVQPTPPSTTAPAAVTSAPVVTIPTATISAFEVKARAEKVKKPDAAVPTVSAPVVNTLAPAPAVVEQPPVRTLSKRDEKQQQRLLKKKEYAKEKYEKYAARQAAAAAAAGAADSQPAVGPSATLDLSPAAVTDQKGAGQHSTSLSSSSVELPILSPSIFGGFFGSTVNNTSQGSSSLNNDSDSIAPSRVGTIGRAPGVIGGIGSGSSRLNADSLLHPDHFSSTSTSNAFAFDPFTSLKGDSSWDDSEVLQLGGHLRDTFPGQWNDEDELPSTSADYEELMAEYEALRQSPLNNSDMNEASNTAASSAAFVTDSPIISSRTLARDSNSPIPALPEAASVGAARGNSGGTLSTPPNGPSSSTTGSTLTHHPRPPLHISSSAAGRARNAPTASSSTVASGSTAPTTGAGSGSGLINPTLSIPHQWAYSGGSTNPTASTTSTAANPFLSVNYSSGSGSNSLNTSGVAASPHNLSTGGSPMLPLSPAAMLTPFSNLFSPTAIDNLTRGASGSGAGSTPLRHTPPHGSPVSHSPPLGSKLAPGQTPSQSVSPQQSSSGLQSRSSAAMNVNPSLRSTSYNSSYSPSHYQSLTPNSLGIPASTLSTLSSLTPQQMSQLQALLASAQAQAAVSNINWGNESTTSPSPAMFPSQSSPSPVNSQTHTPAIAPSPPPQPATTSANVNATSIAVNQIQQQQLKQAWDQYLAQAQVYMQQQAATTTSNPGTSATSPSQPPGGNTSS